MCPVRVLAQVWKQEVAPHASMLPAFLALRATMAAPLEARLRNQALNSCCMHVGVSAQDHRDVHVPRFGRGSSSGKGSCIMHDTLGLLDS